MSLDELQEKISEFEDYVQSTDVAAMQSTSVVYRSIRVLMDVCRALEWMRQGSNWTVVRIARKGVEQAIAVTNMNSICF